MVFQIWSATDKTFCNFGSFLYPFTSLTAQKIKNLEKVKKNPGDIIILQ